jgi:hypothetical protein
VSSSTPVERPEVRSNTGVRRSAPTWGVHVVVAVIGIGASVAALVYAIGAPPSQARLNDFYHEAWPAYAALVHGNVLEFGRVGPGYVGSLVLRAPFAMLPSAWGGSRAVYFASALPCLFAVVAFCTWLAAQPRRRGGIGWASRLMPIMCCVLSPVVLIGLFEGHPEDLLGAVLCVGAVVLAIHGRVGWASLLIGIAVFNKPWALVAVPVVIVVMPRERRRSVILAAAATATAVLGFVLVHGHGLSPAAATATTGDILNPPQLLWWLGQNSWPAQQAHVLIVLVAVPCSALWWLRRRREPWRGESDALLLLALVLLLRCALDPWDTLFYHVPFLFALTAYEIRSGRMPLMTVLYSLALLLVAPPYGIPRMSPDLHAACYAAIVIPMIGWLAARLFVPCGARDRLVGGKVSRLPRWIRPYVASAG